MPSTTLSDLTPRRGLARLFPGWIRFHRKSPAEPPSAAGELARADGMFFGTVPLERWNPDALHVRHGTRIHRRMLEDDQIKALLAFKRAAVTSRPWRFRLPQDTPEQRQCEAFFRFVLEQQLEGTFGQALADLMTSQVYGFSVVEKVYEAVAWQGQERWGMAALKLRPAASFTLVMDVHGNLVELVQQQGAKEVSLPPQRFIRHVNQPNAHPHYGESDLTACYRHWFAKDAVLRQANFAALAQGAAGAPPFAPTSLMWTGQASGGSLNVAGSLRVGSLGTLRDLLVTGQASAAGFDVASAAAAATLLLRGSPPGRPDANTLYKESPCKAWVRFNMATDAISDSFNISSITDGATGRDTINWDREFAGGNYALAALGSDIGVQAAFVSLFSTPVAGSVGVSALNHAGTEIDANLCSIAAFGDQ